MAEGRKGEGKEVIKKPPHSFCLLASTRCRKKEENLLPARPRATGKECHPYTIYFSGKGGKRGGGRRAFFLFFDPGSPSSGRGILQEGELCRGGGFGGVPPQPGRRQGKVVHARPPPPPLPRGVKIELVLILLLFLPTFVPRPRGGRGRHRGRHGGQVQRERGDRGGAERRRAADGAAAAAASAEAGIFAERHILEKALRDASKKRRLLRLRRCLSLAFAFLPPPLFFLGFAFSD